MSTAVAQQSEKRADGRAGSAPSAASGGVEFRYTQTEGFVEILRKLHASLVITTYQANKLLVARVTSPGLSMLVRTFDRPMGLAVGDGRLALGCHDQVWEFRSAPEIAHLVEPAGQHDGCSCMTQKRLRSERICSTRILIHSAERGWPEHAAIATVKRRKGQSPSTSSSSCGG